MIQAHHHFSGQTQKKILSEGWGVKYYLFCRGWKSILFKWLILFISFLKKGVFYCTNHVGMINPNTNTNSSSTNLTQLNRKNSFEPKTRQTQALTLTRTSLISPDRNFSTNSSHSSTALAKPSVTPNDYFVNTDVNHKVKSLSIK